MECSFVGICVLKQILRYNFLKKKIKNEETCSQEAKKHNFQPARMSQCIQQFDGAVAAIRGLLPCTGAWMLVHKALC